MLELKALSEEKAEEISGYSEFNSTLQKSINDQDTDLKKELLARFTKNVLILVGEICPDLITHFSILQDTKELNCFGVFELGLNDEEKALFECGTCFSTVKTDIKTISFVISLMAWNKITWDVYRERGGDIQDEYSEKLYDFPFYMYHYLCQYCEEHYEEYAENKTNYIIDIDSISKIRD